MTYLVLPLLLYIAWMDIREHRIPNWTVLALLALALGRPSRGRPPSPTRSWAQAWRAFPSSPSRSRARWAWATPNSPSPWARSWGIPRW